jgi:hypothetical protein
MDALLAIAAVATIVGTVVAVAGLVIQVVRLRDKRRKR